NKIVGLVCAPDSQLGLVFQSYFTALPPCKVVYDEDLLTDSPLSGNNLDLPELDVILHASLADADGTLVTCLDSLYKYVRKVRIRKVFLIAERNGDNH